MDYDVYAGRTFTGLRRDSPFQAYTYFSKSNLSSEKLGYGTASYRKIRRGENSGRTLKRRSTFLIGDDKSLTFWLPLLCVQWEVMLPGP